LSANERSLMASRFRGFMPVVVDVECGGFNPNTDALLEIAAVLIEIQGDGTLKPGQSWRYHVQPFPGARMEAASLAVTGIDPHHPLRPAIPEKEALNRLFKDIRHAMKQNDCTRAILVGHNAYFDLNFLNAAIARTGIKRSPFHPFSCFDTVTLAGVAFGQTVLSKALQAAGIPWDSNEAHSAAYDAERTAELFCLVCNKFGALFQQVADSDADINDLSNVSGQ
jgi:ribonuclease T